VGEVFSLRLFIRQTGHKFLHHHVMVGNTQNFYTSSKSGIPTWALEERLGTILMPSVRREPIIKQSGVKSGSIETGGG
jgi:hypothetical protein